MSAEWLKGFKSHAALFGFQSQHTELEQLTEWDSREDGLYTRDILRDSGVRVKPGDWQLSVSAEEDGCYEEREIDPRAALDDIGRVVKVTGAAIVGWTSRGSGNGRVRITAIFRGGDWSKVHSGNDECSGCNCQMIKPLDGTFLCPPCEVERVAGWKKWEEKHPATKCEKCGKMWAFDEIQGQPCVKSEKPGDVHWKECVGPDCPNDPRPKCPTCGKGKVRLTIGLVCRDGECRKKAGDPL